MSAASLLLATLVAAGPAAAGADEDLLSMDLAELMQVQVTAQRRVENVQNVPMAITVLPDEHIEVFGAAGEDIRFLSARLPSLTVESSFGRTFPRFYIRGLGNTDFDLNASQPVSLVYDEVVQENPVLKGFPLFDLAQVEMARGPQGSLFGRNSPAGVIKLDSMRPDAREANYARLGWGRYGSANLETAFGGRLAEGWHGRLSLLQQRRDDWVDNTRNGPGADLEGFRDSAARAQLLYAGREGFEALFNLHARALDGSSRVFRANILQAGGGRFVPGFRRDQVSHDGGNRQELDSLGGSLRLRWDFERFSLHSISGYESVEVFSRGDIDGGFGAVYFLPMGPGTILFDTESAAAIPGHRQYSQELRLESRGDGRFDWQAGLYGFDEALRVEDYSYSSTFGAGAQNGYARQRQDNRAWAVFASAGWRPAEQLKLGAGLRFTDDRRDFVGERLQSPLAGLGVADRVGPLRASASDTHVSWDLSAMWSPSAGAHLYARLAEGFRAPSIQGRLLFNDGLSMADTETVVSVEAGIKGEWFERRLRFGLGLFRYRLDNQQLTATGGSGNQNVLVNADQVHGRGLELDLEALLGEHWQLGLGYSYNRTEIDDPALTVAVCGGGCTVTDPTVVVDGATLARIDGNPLPYAPRHILNLTLRYGRPLGAGELFVFTDWAWRSAIELFLYQSREFRSRALAEGGLRVGYSWRQGQRELALFGRNITDELALVGGIDFNNLTGTVNEPRIWGLEFKARF